MKKRLIALDIPEEEIAIQTADIKELKGVDLLSEKCPVRYIITVNALKEGWDCPFAYILATVANRTSRVDVEQIVGRILRLPHAEKKKDEFLNYCYVFTSSNAFQETLKNIVKGLNNAGISEKEFCPIDYATSDTETPQDDVIETVQSSFADIQEETDDTDFDVETVKSGLNDFRNELANNDTTPPEFEEARKQAENYKSNNANVELDNLTLPPEVKGKVGSFSIKKEFKGEIQELLLPQFVIPLSEIDLTEEETKLLAKEDLYSGFELKNKNTEIDFSNVEVEAVKIDVDNNSVPKVKAFKLWENATQREFFRTQPTEEKVKKCKEAIIEWLNKDVVYDKDDLAEFVERVIKSLTPEQIEDLQEDPRKYYTKIKDKINSLRREHSKSTFNTMIDTKEITCKPHYKFPPSITPVKYTRMFPKSLYEAEEDMNDFEKKVVMKLSSDEMINIRWWHRNPSKTGFCINGYINAYPDIIAMTNEGRILVIEPKGDYLYNSDSRQKAEVGYRWESKAGEKYGYFMVFESITPTELGMYSLDKFLEIAKKL